MKNDYIVKYTVMPVNEIYDEPICYIVSKCYVLGKNEEYDENHNIDITYKVIFPFSYDCSKKYDLYWKKSVLPYSIYPSLKNCYKIEIVNNVFDTFEQAIVEKNKLNNEILKESKCGLFSDGIRQVEFEHREILDKYKELEQKIEENTKYMVVNRKNNEHCIIVCKDNKYEIITENDAFYHFISRHSLIDFRAYNISDEDFNEMLRCVSERNTSIFEPKNINNLMIYMKNIKKIFINDYDNPEKVGGLLIDDCCYMRYDPFFQKELIGCSEDVERVYTVETYEDVVKSFASRFLGNHELYKKDEDIIGKKTIQLKRFEWNPPFE